MLGTLDAEEDRREELIDGALLELRELDAAEGLLLVLLRLVGALRTGVRVEREAFDRVVLRGTLVLRDLLLDEEAAELRGDSLTEPLPEEILRLGGAFL